MLGTLSTRVLIAGSITRDTNFVDDDAHSSWGGTVLYAARTYHALGIDCRVVTSAAEPIDEHFPAGVEVIRLSSPVTTTFENYYRADQSRTQRAPHLAPPLPFDADLLDGIDFVHLGALHPDDLAPDWYQYTKWPCALDVQGLCRAIVGGEVVPHADPATIELLQRMRWLKASVREWTLLSAGTVASAELALTRGIEGGELLIGDERWPWRADPPVTNCDPTGAGDTFFAAYLAHRHGAGSGTSDAAASARGAARFTSAFLRSRLR